MALARVAAQSAAKSGVKGAAQSAAKQGTRGRGRGRGMGDGGGEEEEASEAPAPPSDMSARVRSGIKADISSLNKAHDNIQYLMTTDQRTSTIPTMWRRKNVASGEPSIIPVLLELTRAATTKKSVDCGCD